MKHVIDSLFLFRGRAEILEILLDAGADVDGQTNCGRTALHFAVMKEFTKGIGLLMDYEADPNLQVNYLFICYRI